MVEYTLHKAFFYSLQHQVYRQVNGKQLYNVKIDKCGSMPPASVGGPKGVPRSQGGSFGRGWFQQSSAYANLLCRLSGMESKHALDNILNMEYVFVLGLVLDLLSLGYNTNSCEYQQ